MPNIIATGHEGGQFIWNTWDGTWDFCDHVDTTLARYEADHTDLVDAAEAARGTLLHDIELATDNPDQ